MLPVALGVWAAALIATNRPDLAVALAGVLWATACVLLPGLPVLARRRRRDARPRPTWIAIAAVAVAFSAGSVSVVAMNVPDRDQALALPLSGGRMVVIEADVTGKIEASPTGWRFDAVTSRVHAGDADVAVRVPIIVRTPARPAGLDLGSAVSLTGSASPARAGERAVLVVTSTAPPSVFSTPHGPLALAATLREALIEQAASLPQPGAGLVPGLAVGDTAAVTAELDAQMKTASLSHLTAVSGANCALVVGIAFVGAGMLGLRRPWRVAIGLAALSGFVILVSPEPSVVRAAAMAAIAMLAALLGRAGAGASVLCLAIVLCLIADPWLAGSIGFALSATATAALVLFAGPVSDSLHRAMPRPLALAIAVPAAAQLACTPILVMIDPRLPVYAVLANALTAPAAPLATIAGLAACLSVGMPWLASGLAVIAWLPCAWIAATAEAVDVMPGNSIDWLPDTPGVALATVLCAALLLSVLPRTPRRTRWVSAGLVALVAGAAAGSALVTGPLERARTPDDWAVAQCDVGQGDAVLLRSGDTIALVDTGPDPAALAACLDRFGVERVDLLILTHFDLDHVGGADAIVGRVGTVLHGPVADPKEQALLTRLSGAGGNTVEASAGMAGLLSDAEWQVLWPRPGSDAFAPGNDASVVIDVRGGGIPATLLLGDLSEGPQLTLGAALRSTYDVVKVSHHGSADQSPSLYRRLDARVALIGVGENSYGHPRDETLALLRSLGHEIVRTDETGAAALTVTDDGIRVWRERVAARS